MEKNLLVISVQENLQFHAFSCSIPEEENENLQREIVTHPSSSILHKDNDDETCQNHQTYHK